MSSYFQIPPKKNVQLYRERSWIWYGEKGEGLKEVSKAKTKTLSSPQNISYPRTQTQQRIQETGLAVSQTLCV